MVVYHSALRALARQEAIPRRRVGETVLDHDHCRTSGHTAHRVEAKLVVLLGGAATARQVGHKRLVEQLDANDNVGVGRIGVLGCDHLDHVLGMGNRVVTRPAGGVDALARIVKAILRAWCAVQVDPDFEAGLARPVNSLIEMVLLRVEDVRILLVLFEGPVSCSHQFRIHRRCRSTKLKIGGPYLSEF